MARRLPTHTPGYLYFVQRNAKGALWRVVSISEEQGRAMRERGLQVFKSSAQAYAIARGLNVKLEAQDCEMDL